MLDPEEKVTVAVPLASVTTVEDPRIPVSALMVTVTPGIAAFAVFSEVTVIVEVEPSVLMVVGEADRSRETAVVSAVLPAPPAVLGLPLPHPARSTVAITINNDGAVSLVIFVLKLSKKFSI